MKKLLSMILVLTMAVSLCGCQRKADQALLTAAENMEKFDSMTFRVDLDVTAFRNGQETPIAATATSSTMEDEGLTCMTMDLKVDDVTMDVEIYREQQGFHSMEYRGVDMGRGREWTRKEGSPFKMVSPVPTEEILRYFTDLEETDETAVIGGRVGTRYNAVIKGPDFGKLIKLLQLLGGMGRDAGEAISAADGKLNVPLAIYMDTEDQLILKISLDATDLLEAGGVLNSKDLEIECLEFSIEYSEFGEVEPIIIPDEARNAPLEKAD